MAKTPSAVEPIEAAFSNSVRVRGYFGNLMFYEVSTQFMAMLNILEAVFACLIVLFTAYVVFILFSPFRFIPD